MKLLPRWLVDRLPITWWHPGNLHSIWFGDLHFCAGDWVRTIEWNGRVIGEGKQPFRTTTTGAEAGVTAGVPAW